MTPTLWSRFARSAADLFLVPVSLLFFLATSAAGTAWAAPPNETSLDVQLFQQAIGPGNFMTIDAPDIARHKQLGFGLTLNYQLRPYVGFSQTPDQTGTPITVDANVVDHQLTAELAAAIALFERVQIGFALPYTPLLQGDVVDDSERPTGQRQSVRGIGDVRVEAKALIGTAGEDDQFALGVLAGISIPTAKAAGPSVDVPVAAGGPYYLGDKGFTGRIKVLGGAQFGDLRVAGNLGVLLRSTSQSFAATVGNQLLYGVGLGYEVRKRIEVILEGYGRSGLSDFKEFWADANPFEIDASVRVGVNSMWAVTVGAGRGFNGIGAPSSRGFLAGSFTPDFRDRDGDGIYDADDKCPDQAEDKDGFQDNDGCPDPDNDNDGIPDAQDKCPNDAEDFDQFEDEDGCPELDNDKDGIPDLNDACPNAAEDGRGKRPKDGCPSTSEDSDGDGVNDTIDKCPDEPEDRDGFQDDDGCPDPDNDGDGIPDNFDNCPNEAEDGDGFEDEDGCPDPDNDKDGIPDAQDKCPNEPETWNGIKDDDGCPDPGAPIVRLTNERIELEERIGFNTRGGKSELKESAQRTLGVVALVMKGHTEIKKLDIDVHADGVPKEETQRRAELIRDALVAKGVEAARLNPRGMGGGGARVELLIEATAAAAPAKAAPAPAQETQPPAP